uniref:Uncharacterized protein n=1 Tax=Aegilops tauschii subsp. strangulata TaxID=200361 RepID=A0A453M0L1_AEGTS
RRRRRTRPHAGQLHLPGIQVYIGIGLVFCCRHVQTEADKKDAKTGNSVDRPPEFWGFHR